MSELISKIKEYFLNLSERERNLVLAAFAVALIIAVYSVVGPISAALKSQDDRFQATEKKLNTLPVLLDRYSKLRSGVENIKARYQEVEIKEGLLSHLENLVKTRAGVTKDFTFKRQPSRPFGTEYEHEPVNIDFSTDDLSKVVRLLDALVNGEKPVIVSRLEMRKVQRRGGELAVTIGVSSIRKRGTES